MIDGMEKQLTIRLEASENRDTRSSYQVRALWSTLVLQTDVSESYSKLKEEAKWWFEHSDGDVSIVLIIAINQAYVRFEIVQRPLQIAPCTTQPRPYSVQQVITTPSTVTGGPMILPFQTLYDRGRGQIETGIAITAEDLRDIADDISWINLNEG
ncbi:hypothetical protein AWENTII_000702 [Aspergillus wentii]